MTEKWIEYLGLQRDQKVEFIIDLKEWQRTQIEYFNLPMGDLSKQGHFFIVINGFVFNQVFSL